MATFVRGEICWRKQRLSWALKSLEDSQAEVAVSKGLEARKHLECLDDASTQLRCQAEAVAFFSGEPVRILMGRICLKVCIWRQEDPTREGTLFQVRAAHEWDDKVFTGTWL